jgi:hypothetical protein
MSTKFLEELIKEIDATEIPKGDGEVPLLEEGEIFLIEEIETSFQKICTLLDSLLAEMMSMREEEKQRSKDIECLKRKKNMLQEMLWYGLFSDIPPELLEQEYSQLEIRGKSLIAALPSEEDDFPMSGLWVVSF